MPRWFIAVLAVFFAIFVLTTVLSGEPAYLIPIVILALLAVGYSLLNKRATERIIDKHGGDREAAVSDNEDPLPSAHLVPDSDEDRPLGDTAEAHDELSVHDLPKGSDARLAAEEQIEAEGGRTRGNVEGAQGGGAPSDSTAESR